MLTSLVAASYLAAAILFILTLRGLSNQESARRGNLMGMVGMGIAILATIASVQENIMILVGGLAVGGTLGFILSRRVQMTQMPELVAFLHSLVGLAAVIVGFANFYDPVFDYVGVERSINATETAIGVIIGALTFTGSVVAYGKLSGKIGGNPLLLPARHWLNLGILVALVFLTIAFVSANHSGGGFVYLVIMTLLAMFIGVHLVAAIGGADMPVVISMLNSYSGWAATAMGFMLSNDLLILTGALVGSSGAILSYIMCKAMNRNFIAVISGGYGLSTSSSSSSSEIEGEIEATSAIELAEQLKHAKNVMIVPGYGMAVAQAQHIVSEIVKALQSQKVNVRFAIHPVAGRMPGHMNVLLAEAKVPYDIVYEMDEVNDDFSDVDITIIVGANDIVNPSAQTDADSPIAGMPVLEVWKSESVVVLKRGMAAGYAGVENPLFYKDNTRMLFGDAQSSLDEIFRHLK